MRLVNLLLGSLIIVISSVSPVRAQELEKHLGRLAEIVDLGVDAPWETRLEGGWFNMVNQTEGDAMRYYVTDFPPLQGGTREVRVNTALVGYGDGPGFAGVMFDWKSNTEFGAFLIGSDGSVMALVRTPEGFETYPAEDSIRAKLDGSDVIVLRETPGQIDMVLNGESVLSSDSDTGFVPNFGIVAVGKGRFAFTGFTVDTRQGTGGAFPAPGGGGGDSFPSPGGSSAPFPAPAGGNGQTSAPPPAGNPAPGGLSAGDETRIKAVLGTTLSVFLHEFAHALIGETGLPATGPEEDTADAFSAIMMAGAITMGDTTGAASQDNSWGEQMSEYGALFWYYSGLAQQNTAPGRDDWQDEHAPDLKRFRNAFCMMYGMAPDRFSDVADRVGFNEDTRARCLEDSEKQLNAWLKILATVQRSGGVGTAGQMPANAPGGVIRARFEPTNSEAGQLIKYFMGDSGIFQSVLDVFSQMFVLPRDIVVSFENCDALNAWYDPQSGNITLCYKLFDLTTEIVVAGENANGQGGGQMAPAPSGGRTGGTAAGNMSDAEAYLLGIWDGQFEINGGMYPAIIYYDTDRTYGLKFDSPYGEITVLGIWSANVAGNATINLVTIPSDWEPKQLCDAGGNCVENTMQADNTMVDVLDDNTVNVDGIQWRRRQ